MDTPSLAVGADRTRSLGHFPAAVYRWMQRRVRARMKLAHILLLTTTGNDSGELQTVAMGYFVDGLDLVIVGSNYGNDLHSTWYLNLNAHPHVGVQIEENFREMVASTATPTERAQFVERLATEDKQYGRYQQMTDREIPIVILHPVDLSPAISL